MLTVGSLFSGIGGLDLGLERAGMRVAWQSEIDPYACKVLAKHWPEVPNHGNIKEIDWRRVEPVDVICGGYPCQPFSTAGKRRGEDDPRHLWPWVREAISELRPRYAILENVRGHLSLGGTTVLAEIAALGYDAEWRVVSAASVGANHRRDRVIIVAYPNKSRPQRRPKATDTQWESSDGHFGQGSANVADSNSGDTTDGRQCAPVPSQGRSGRNDRGRSSSHIGQISVGSARQNSGDVAYPNDAGSGTSRRGDKRQRSTSQQGWEKQSQSWASGCGATLANTDSSRRIHTCHEVFSTDTRQQALAELAIGSWWATEPDVGRVANGIPSRVDRLRGLGNAVVPQVAEVIGRLVVAHAEHN